MSLLHYQRKCSVVHGLFGRVPDLRAFAHSPPDGPGRIGQILAIEFVEFGRCSSSKGREHVRGVEFGTRVGPDRVRQILGVEAVEGS